MSGIPALEKTWALVWIKTNWQSAINGGMVQPEIMVGDRRYENLGPMIT
jgi:hypothetical protein